MIQAAPPMPVALTAEQDRIVQFGDGPAVVIAGAGTGKTRVIVERVRWLLNTYGRGSRDALGRLLPDEPEERPGTAAVVAAPAPAPSRAPAIGAAVTPAQVGLWPAEAEPEPVAPVIPEAAGPSSPGLRPDPRLEPFAGPLLPEQILVLTYNVKAARELQDRLDAALGPAVRARMSVSNFHSFCHQVLTQAGAEAGLPAHPEVLDGIGQVLLLRDIEPGLDLFYHGAWWAFGSFVQFINRAKDELVTPDDFDAYVAEERAVFESRYGPLGRRDRTPRAPGQPQDPARAAQGVRPAAQVRAGRGSRRRPARGSPPFARQGRRPGGPPDGPGHRGGPARPAFQRGRAGRDRPAGGVLRHRRRRSRDRPARGAGPGLSGLPGRADRPRRAGLRRADCRGHQALEDASEHPSALAADLSATSWSTSSRTPTSPRSS